MATEYKFDKGKKACEKCSRPFEPAEEFISTLHTVGETFERKNWCGGCWTAPGADVYSFWRVRMPERTVKRADNRATLLQLFENRVRQQSTEPMDEKLTYLLSLILVQKRQFRLRETVRHEGRECLDLLKVADDQAFLVPVAAIGEAEVDALKEQLEKLLGS